jgi:hypothetical protein
VFYAINPNWYMDALTLQTKANMEPDKKSEKSQLLS